MHSLSHERNKNGVIFCPCLMNKLDSTYFDIQQLIYCSVLLFAPFSITYLYMKISYAQIFYIETPNSLLKAQYCFLK